MTKNLKRLPNFDDILFEFRNKEYGAYIIRKNYGRNVLISLFIGIFILTTAVITPFLRLKVSGNRQNTGERKVEIKMENLDQPSEKVVIPPPPPPPPASVVQQVRYIPPVVVDSVNPDEAAKLMTVDEAQVKIKNDNVEVKEEIKKEVDEEKTQTEPFLNVEEMPVPEGGESGLLKYIAENTKYPEEARENNIKGTVVVKFCVTSKGSVDLVSILKSVDPELDSEAIRVVKSLPPFKPGKHQGKPVPVWYVAPINFTLQ
jgi:protein TonB